MSLPARSEVSRIEQVGVPVARGEELVGYGRRIQLVDDNDIILKDFTLIRPLHHIGRIETDNHYHDSLNRWMGGMTRFLRSSIYRGIALHSEFASAASVERNPDLQLVWARGGLAEHYMIARRVARSLLGQGPLLEVRADTQGCVSSNWFKELVVIHSPDNQASLVREFSKRKRDAIAAFSEEKASGLGLSQAFASVDAELGITSWAAPTPPKVN